MFKKFFKSENERNLWIRLNAERIKYSNEVNNRIINEDIGNVDKEYSPMWISKNQLEFDENEKDALRFSFEELLTLSPQELYKLSKEKNQDKLKEFIHNL
jgi:hypothetical protein